MDPRCLDYQLTEAEAVQFKQDGYFMVENALEPEHVARLKGAFDRVDSEERARLGHGPYDRINHYDFIGKDDAFLELLDWYKTFPKVWGILGWHVQLYHTHMTCTPVEPDGKTLEQDGLDLGWHQDSGQLNSDFETEPRPMVSLKIGFFLTDTSEPHRGNFHVVPGSQIRNDFPGEDRKDLLDGATPVLAPAGTAVFFDRRIWHSGSANYWLEPRRVLFYGYSYRWLRPRDDMTVDHYLDRCDPVQQQLLGVTHSGGRGYTSPQPEDVPLKAWIDEHIGEGEPA